MMQALSHACLMWSVLHRTVVGVAGENYVIIAASTRMSTSFSILTRHSSKFVQMCAPEHAPCCDVTASPS